MNNSSNRHSANDFSDSIHGIPCVRIKTSEGQAAIAAQGAQVLSWSAADGRERLYLSEQSLHLRPDDADGVFGPAIRGGVPVCFPQFSDCGALMKHGFARSRFWGLGDEAPSGGADTPAASSVQLRFSDDDATRSHWPHSFSMQLRAELSAGRLRIDLRVQNSGDAPFSFTLALHTYLRVADIRQTTLAGLQGIRFEDATKGLQVAVQQEERLSIREEVDRVYLDAPEQVILYEGDDPSLLIRQQGFIDTVVWNPGPDKAKALGDFPDEDWLRMLCVEAACAAAPIVLAPGEAWTGSQVLSVPDA